MNLIDRRFFRSKLGSRVSRRQGTKHLPRAGNKQKTVVRVLKARPRTRLAALIEAQRPDVLDKQRREAHAKAQAQIAADNAKQSSDNGTA